MTSPDVIYPPRLPRTPRLDQRLQAVHVQVHGTAAFGVLAQYQFGVAANEGSADPAETRRAAGSTGWEQSPWTAVSRRPGGLKIAQAHRLPPNACADRFDQRHRPPYGYIWSRPAGRTSDAEFHPAYLDAVTDHAAAYNERQIVRERAPGAGARLTSAVVLRRRRGFPGRICHLAPGVQGHRYGGWVTLALSWRR